ncbi:MAG: diaminopimelate epimerase [Kineosporiaceae bacterium]|nr:diaminopimelate epimerase [Kineosporiaceae bacterium]
MTSASPPTLDVPSPQAPTSPLAGLSWAKGHGTENDFVVLPDPDGRLQLDAPAVQALCDRRAGLGGDGILRVVRSAEGEAGRWFMDYRNADGSLAEMCGNGIRVFVHYLVRAGLLDLADGDSIAIDTRAGVKTVRREGEQYAVDLGPWRIEGGTAAAEAGSDRTVHAHGSSLAQAGLSVNIGNPHVVVAVPDVATLRALDLTRAPVLDPVAPEGANVEFVVPGHGVDRDAAGRPLGHLVMRVHERGSGETRSCGTGAVAAVLAARVWAGDGAPDEWTVDVPGGRLLVRLAQGSPLAGEHAELVGPARIVAEGTLLG